MNGTFRRRFEMGVRVRDFLREHRTEGPEAAALAQLEKLLERADALAAQQRDGVVVARGSVKERAVVRKALTSKLLLCLSGVAAVASKENVALGEAFRLPRGGISNQAFVTLARDMLDKATEHKELLVKQGLAESVFTDIAAALEQFEHSLETTRAGRRAHVGASGDLAAVASEVSEQVRLLEGLVRYRFGHDPELMTTWSSVRNVVGHVRTQEEEPPLAEGEEKAA